MNESKPLTHSPFAALGGVRYPAHTPRPGMKPWSAEKMAVVEAAAQQESKPVVEANGVVEENGSSVNESASEGSDGEAEQVGSNKKKRRRRMHDAEFVEKVISATKKTGATYGAVAKEFDVSPTLVSRWVAFGVPRRGRKKSATASVIGKFEASRVVPKAQSGVTGLDRICLLLEQSAKLQQESAKSQAQSMELQRQAFEEMATMGAALRTLFQGK